MIILFTEKNPASRNIAEKLIKKGAVKTNENEWKINGSRIFDTGATTVLDVPTNFNTDCILVLSSHKSKNPVPMLTVHFPGNWLEAEMGGKSKTLNTANASKLKQLFLALTEANKKHGLNWPVLLEADHHGPLSESGSPIIFIEIGSSEKEWNDERAAEVVADAVFKSLPEPKKYKSFFGVGGGHYAKEFSELISKNPNYDSWAVGHILPKYAIDEVHENVLQQAIETSVERTEKVVLLKESTNAKQKEKIRDFCERNGIKCEEI